jgi:precorrin-6B methylase 2
MRTHLAGMIADVQTDLPVEARRESVAATASAPWSGFIQQVETLMNSSQPTPQRIMEMAWGYAPPLILESAVRNGLFDALEKGPRSLDEVVKTTGVSLRGAAAILNALVGFGFVSKTDGKYALSPDSAAFLVRGKPGYLGGFLSHISSQLIPNWLHLTEITQSGMPREQVNSEKQGAEFFKQLVKDIYPLSFPAATILAESLSAELHRGSARVLDLAAGSGVWGLTLAAQAKSVAVTAVDWPGVTPVTQEVAQKLGLADRLNVINGDILEADLGTGYRIATLGHILHSEGVERSRRLLQRVFHALEPGGTIAIAEFVVNQERTGSPQGLIFAVNMLVHTREGDTYSIEEMSDWLKQVGFTAIRTLDVHSHSPLLLATKKEI